jgi:hypothetical protein
MAGWWLTFFTIGWWLIWLHFVFLPFIASSDQILPPKCHRIATALAGLSWESHVRCRSQEMSWATCQIWVPKTVVNQVVIFEGYCTWISISSAIGFIKSQVDVRQFVDSVFLLQPCACSIWQGCCLNLQTYANKIEQLHLWWCANWLYCRCTCAVMRPCYIAGHTQWQIFRRGPCKRQPRTAHARRQQKRAVQHNFDGELGHGWLPVTLDILNSDMSFFHLFPRRPLEATKSSSP